MEDPSPSQTVLSSIKQFALREYDWDGIGGLPLRCDVADIVANVYTLEFADDSPVPTVSLNGNGSVEVSYDQIENSDLGRKLLLTFQCEGAISYIKVYAGGESTIEGTIRFDRFGRPGERGDDFEELPELFEWINAED